MLLTSTAYYGLGLTREMEETTEQLAPVYLFLHLCSAPGHSSWIKKHVLTTFGEEASSSLLT
jgi:hypothetical protein